MQRKTTFTYLTSVLPLLSFLLLCLASCDRELPPSFTDDGEGTAIGFSTREDAGTRADGTPAPAIDNFRVWCSMTRTDGEGAPTSIHHFDEAGTEVSYTDGKWTYTPLRFWRPFDFSFAALHPTNPTIVDDGSVSCSPSPEPVIVIKKFNIMANQRTQDTLLVAFNYGLDGADANVRTSPVSLQFHHLLSKLRFNARKDTDAADIVIKEIKLYGNLYETDLRISKGSGDNPVDFQFGKSASDVRSSSTTPFLFLNNDKGWTLPYIPKQDSSEENPAPADESGSETKPVNIVDQVLVLPEKRSSYEEGSAPEIVLSVIYYITITDDDGTSDTIKKDAKFPLPYEWESGKIYTYTLVVDPKDIVLTEPSVTVWDPVDGWFDSDPESEGNPKDTIQM